MASISSTNVNEFLPGLEDFLRSMLNSTHLNTDHRQVAVMYLDKLDQLSQSSNQQSSIMDDPSLMNTDILSDEEETDDFTDEEEEEEQQQQQTTSSVTRHASICDNQLYNTTEQESNVSNSQWYIDTPRNDYFESLPSQSLNEHSDISSSIIPRRLSISTSSSSSSILADGLLLTYDKNHNWIWRYYVLDNFDLICFPADKKSRLTSQGQSENNCSPLWVSDMTNAKVHSTVIDKIECLCLQIGLAEAIYVRPSDPNQMNIWLKAFRDAASSQKSKDNSKTRNNVKTLSRNARRMFTQFNRKKGQIVSHFLDQMANVTGVDDKTRKHCELRGFLVISLDNSIFVTKYCTIVDGIFRIHKSRLSEQTDHEFDLNHCTLSFPEERTRDIQFALTDKQNGRIFIRGNNIYSMGRLLNTLAKYVEIQGSSQTVFQSIGTNLSTPLSKSQPSHVYSDVNSSSQSNGKPLPLNLTKNIYRSASQLHDDQTFTSPTSHPSNCDDRNITPIQQETSAANEIYDEPKSYDNMPSIDRNNNQIFILPKPRERIRNENENTLPILPSSTNISSHRSKLKLSHQSSSLDAASTENTTFSIHPPDSTLSEHLHRRPYPLPRRSSIDCVNKFTKLFARPSNDRHISTQTYDTIQASIKNDESISKRLYDIPIATERPRRFPLPTSVMDEDEETTYDNLSKSDGIGKFRFVIPFNHSPRSAFTTIKPINSPSSSSSSPTSSNSTMPQTSSSSNYSNTNNNNNNSNNRTRLMTAV